MPARELDRTGPLAQADAALVYVSFHLHHCHTTDWPGLLRRTPRACVQCRCRCTALDRPNCVVAPIRTQTQLCQESPGERRVRARLGFFLFLVFAPLCCYALALALPPCDAAPCLGSCCLIRFVAKDQKIFVFLPSASGWLVTME